jgi:hypothetical protein
VLDAKHGCGRLPPGLSDGCEVWPTLETAGSPGPLDTLAMLDDRASRCWIWRCMKAGRLAPPIVRGRGQTSGTALSDIFREEGVENEREETKGSSQRDEGGAPVEGVRALI